MAFRIRWTESAANDFEKIAQQIEIDTDSVESCKIARRIHQRVEGLKDYPRIGEALEAFPSLRRRIVDGFKIVYQVFEADEVIEITRILSQRQDLSLYLEP